MGYIEVVNVAEKEIEEKTKDIDWMRIILLIGGPMLGIFLTCLGVGKVFPNKLDNGINMVMLILKIFFPRHSVDENGIEFFHQNWIVENFIYRVLGAEKNFHGIATYIEHLSMKLDFHFQFVSPFSVSSYCSQRIFCKCLKSNVVFHTKNVV